MSDIVERAESFLIHTPYAPLPRHMSERLLKELKAERAKNEQLQAHFDRAMGAK